MHHLINADKFAPVLIARSTEQARSYLNGVYLDPKGVLVAANGHILVAARLHIGEDIRQETLDVDYFKVLGD